MFYLRIFNHEVLGFRKPLPAVRRYFQALRHPVGTVSDEVADEGRVVAETECEILKVEPVGLRMSVCTAL